MYLLDSEITLIIFLDKLFEPPLLDNFVYTITCSILMENADFTEIL